MLFTAQELIDVVLMTLGVGFIFMDFFKVPRVVSFDWRALGWSCLVTAPAIILHELGHKFTAIGFGAEATFHAAYLFLLLGIILKIIRSPFIFFVPGYVTIPAILPAFPLALVAFAGPGVNGLLYVLAVVVLAKTQPSRRAHLFWLFTRKINGFLFIFNLLPIPGFDGYNVLRAFLSF
ncbi:M50 family metallopeptidase [Candidatus Woesearchaeota archaeon]|nr:M50 family metallopeptidase [Candidatus Woesearchaeota archaeon]